MSGITVIGLDGKPLSSEAEGLLREAALVAGGERHLRSLGVEPERAVLFKGDLSEALSRIEHAESYASSESGSEQRTCASCLPSPPSPVPSPSSASPGTTP